jgi:hypothetical protein
VEGLGIGAVARVFEVDPHTVRQWLGAAADPLKACSQYCRPDVRGTQVPLDARFARLRAGKGGERSEAEARERLERSPPWGWTAMAPERQWLRAIDVGERTRAMAPGGGSSWARCGRPAASRCA